MKHIIFMAAGNSERFGSNKLLKLFRGKPLFRYGLDVLRSVTSERDDCTLTVITQYEEISEFCSDNGVRCIINPDSRCGASFTIRAGICAAQPRQGDFLVFAAADQPGIQRDTVHRLLDCAQEGVQAARVYYGSTPGNPVLFSASLIPELNALSGDDGGRTVLKAHECIKVQALSSGELKDVDVPNDIR